MKCYGMSRRDKLSCKYGCCLMDKGENVSYNRGRLVKRARGAARQQARREISQEV